LMTLEKKTLMSWRVNTIHTHPKPLLKRSSHETRK
jgi:hypothetical protein